MMGQAIQESRRQIHILKDTRPLRERQIGGHQKGPLFVPLGEDLKEQLRSFPRKRQIPELIHDQERVFAHSRKAAFQLFLFPGLHQGIDQIGRGGE